MVLMDQPIKAVLHRTDASKRIAKWAIELTELDINYRPRPSIKAQILVDFVVECTIPIEVELGQSGADTKVRPSLDKAELSQPNLPEGFWALRVDASSNSAGASAGLVLVSPEGVVAEYALHFEFSATNNGAEYKALIIG